MLDVFGLILLRKRGSSVITSPHKHTWQPNIGRYAKMN